jgi:anti-sigma factor RsiW
MGRCEDLIQNLSDYIDGELDPELCSELEEHLKDCKNCRLMLDTMKMTVKLCKDGERRELPAGLNKKLNEQLARRWKNTFGHL